MQNLEAASVGGLPPWGVGANRGSAGRACGFSGGSGGLPRGGSPPAEHMRVRVRGKPAA
jgi:hypothetical protein